jgi:hypothetical protein
MPTGERAMNCWKLSITVGLVFFFRLHANAGEAEDRIAEFLTHQSEVEACMSVLISWTEISEWIDQNANDHLSASELLQRMIICKDTNEMRMDAMSKPLDQDLVSKESQLIAGGECLYWTSVRIQQDIQRIEMKAGRPMRRTNTSRLNPFSLPVATLVVIKAEMPEYNIFHNELQIIEEYELKDGRYRAYFAGNGWGDRGACEVTFAKEPRWTPVEYRMYTRRDAPKPSGKLTGDVIKNWKLINTTTTEWQAIDDEPGWLPCKVTMDFESKTVDSYEFLLTDWKLGKDVDRSPLQKSQFTPQNIPKQIDFDKVAAEFDEMRAKEKK